MTIDTKSIRNAAAILDTLTSNLAADHPLRVEAQQGAKAAVADLYRIADQINPLAAENARLRTAIIAARREIPAEREGLMVCHGIEGVVPADDKIGTEAIAGLDLLLNQIDVALTGESK